MIDRLLSYLADISTIAGFFLLLWEALGNCRSRKPRLDGKGEMERRQHKSHRR